IRIYCPIAVRHRTIKCALAYSVQGIYSRGSGRRLELSFHTAVPSFLAIDFTTGHGQPLLRASEVVLSYSVLIVDDSALIRHSLRSCLEQDPEWRVCGGAEDGKIAVERAKELHPDVVILDLQMPEMDGLAAARQITAVAPETAMVMFTMHSDGQLL